MHRLDVHAECIKKPRAVIAPGFNAYKKPRFVFYIEDAVFYFETFDLLIEFLGSFLKSCTDLERFDFDGGWDEINFLSLVRARGSSQSLKFFLDGLGGSRLTRLDAWDKGGKNQG